MRREGKTVCLAHYNYHAPIAVKVKERELVVPFQFAVPVERQLSAASAVSINVAPKPEAIAYVAREGLIAEMREFVWEMFCEDPKRGRPSAQFKCAMVMIAPIWMPYDAGVISATLGYAIGFVATAMQRMREAKICYQLDGSLFYEGEWPALWVLDPTPEGEELFKLCISFIIDAKTVEGTLTRSRDADGQFVYSVLAA